MDDEFNSAFYTCLNLPSTSIDMEVWDVQRMQVIKLSVKKKEAEG